MFHIDRIEMNNLCALCVYVVKMHFTFILNIQTGFHVDSPVYNSVCAHPSG